MNTNKLKRIPVKLISVKGSKLQSVLEQRLPKYEVYCMFDELTHSANDWFLVDFHPENLWCTSDNLDQIMDDYPSRNIGMTYRELIEFINEQDWVNYQKNIILNYLYSEISEEYMTGKKDNIPYIDNLIETTITLHKNKATRTSSLRDYTYHYVKQSNGWIS